MAPIGISPPLGVSAKVIYALDGKGWRRCELSTQALEVDPFQVILTSIMNGMIQIESVDKRNNPNSRGRYKKAR